MLLTNVKIHKYKSFVSEQSIDMDSKVTRIVGKNESGKTAVLEAMAKTCYYESNDVFKFDKTLDYPRGFLTKIDGQNPEAVTCEYKLTDELDIIADALGDGTFTTEIFSVTTKYDNTATVAGIEVDFEKFISFIIKEYSIDGEDRKLLKGCKSIKEIIDICEDNAQLKSLQTFLESIISKNKSISTDWGNELKKYIYFFYIKPNIPKFWYFSEYYSMPCRFNIDKFAEGNSDKALSNEEYMTAKALFELSGLKIEDLKNENDFENFKAKLESTSNSITDDLFKYWKTNDNLEIRFDVEHIGGSRFLNIRIYNSKHRVTLPLRNRSKGFLWFFSFLVWFSKIQGNKDEKYILLLDEPGLSLHASAQADLLRFIDEVLSPNYQVVYTTHSPFMIDSTQLHQVRTVYDDLDKTVGSVVSDALEEKDSTTLFPLQAALGYNIAQNLYISQKNLLVEGISDLVYLTHFSNLLSSMGKTGLKSDITIVPVGGADKIATFVSLMRGNELNAVCLLDSFRDMAAKARLDNMIVQNIIKEKKVIFYSSILKIPFADIEDLLAKEEYLCLYNGAFQKNINISQIDMEKPIIDQLTTLNGNKRFNHYSPARHLISNLPNYNFSQTTIEHFDELFETINRKFR